MGSAPLMSGTCACGQTQRLKYIWASCAAGRLFGRGAELCGRSSVPPVGNAQSTARSRPQKQLDILVKVIVKAWSNLQFKHGQTSGQRTSLVIASSASHSRSEARSNSSTASTAVSLRSTSAPLCNVLDACRKYSAEKHDIDC